MVEESTADGGIGDQITIVAGPDVRTTGDHIAFAQGSLVDRYVILGRLGSGGMGIVYAAYDPELDRRVALKLLLSPKSQGEAQTRLLREAQALARLQHPNVVAVYDVGVLGEQVWAAMELVEGVTLKAWLTTQARPWRGVLEVMEAVGRGLAAAHQAGLVHRDIKPDNVMISGDGRVRVVDFGLARADEAEDGRETVEDERGFSDELAGHLASESRSALRTDLTHEGSIIGTPSYMAPELFAGAQADARSDQFAWCVTCWEALHGGRPFVGETIGQLVIAASSGRISPPLKSTTPGWLRRVLERGLGAVSSERYPSMDALLGALAQARRRSRRLRRVGVVAAVVALIAGGLATHVLRRAAQRTECEALGGSITALWSPMIREEVERVFVATGRPYAGTSYRHVAAALDEYTGEWSKAQAELCVAARIDQSLTPELAAAMFDCLEEGRLGLAVVVDNFSRASDDDVLENAVTLASSLPPISACRDPVLAGRRPPVVNMEVIGPLRQALAEIGALHHVGKTERASVLLEALMPRIEASGNEEVRARALLLGGVLAGDLGDLELADLRLRAAFESALAGGMDELAARAVERIAHNSRALARADEALRWIGVGRALLRRLGAEDGLIAARLGLVEGDTRIELGEPEAARSAIERALEIERRVLGANHPTLGGTLNGLGIVFEDLGDLDQANAHYEEARRMLVASLGERHPMVARVEENLGNVCWARGELDMAIVHHRRALEIRVAAFGTEHAAAGLSHLNLGNAFYSKGELDAAEAAYLRALEITEAALGPDHSRVAYALVNLGGVYLRKRELDAAERVLHRALEIRVASFGREHPGVAYVLANLGGAAVSRGELDLADTYLVESLATMEKVRGPEHVDLLAPLMGMGEVAIARGDAAAGQELFARALSIAQRGVDADSSNLAEPLIGYGVAALAADDGAAASDAFARALRVTGGESADPVLRASACFGAARALARTGDDEGARERASEALDLYQTLGPGYADKVEEVRRWLADVG